jgi:apolipoprotein N-acyltransferase
MSALQKMAIDAVPYLTVDKTEKPDSISPVRTVNAAGQWRLLGMWGVVMALAVPVFNLWPLAYVALVPLLLVALRCDRPWRAAGFVFLGATAWWALMTTWLIQITMPGWGVLAGYCALYTVGFAFSVRLVERRFGLPYVFSVPILCIGFEWLRGSIILGGFPWFCIGNSQPTWMIQIADLGSYHLVGFVVATVNGLILDLLLRPLFRPVGDVGPRYGVALRISAPWALALCLGSLAYGVMRVSEYESDSDHRSMVVAVVQTNIPQSNKDSSSWSQMMENFDQMLHLAK